MPEPYRCGQIFEIDDHSGKAVGLAGIVGRSELQHYLILITQIQCLKMTAAAQVPNVQLVPVATLHEYLRVKSAFDHFRRAPLAGDHGVVAQMPPEVVGEVLWATLNFPTPQGIKALVIHDEDAARAIPIGGTKGTHIYALRAAMDGMGTAIARTVVQLLRLYHPDDLRLLRVG